MRYTPTSICVLRFPSMCTGRSEGDRCRVQQGRGGDVGPVPNHCGAGVSQRQSQRSGRLI